MMSASPSVRNYTQKSDFLNKNPILIGQKSSIYGKKNKKYNVAKNSNESIALKLLRQFFNVS
jgi:hypothetical protein